VIAAASYQLSLWQLLAGLVLLGGCLFVAGWVGHREYELFLRATGRHRRRDSEIRHGRAWW
jgi:hypothetical protein